MKRTAFICVLFSVLLSACSGWTVEPLPYVSSTPFPSATPIIVSATPVIPASSITAMAGVTPAALTNTPAPASTAPTGTNTQVVTETVAVGPTTSAPATITPASTAALSPSVNTKILGCSNGLDITHGMGEVTNAYITIQNTSSMDLANVCATLNMLGEGRVHPDKTKCISSLPVGYQVTEKLTVDSTLGKDSPIQVDVDLGVTLLQRVAQNYCADFNLFGPKINGLWTVTPIPTP